MIRETTSQYSKNPSHRFLELNMYTIIGRKPYISVEATDHMKVHY